MIDFGIKEYTIEYLKSLNVKRAIVDTYTGIIELHLPDGAIEEVNDGVVWALWDYIVYAPESKSFGEFQRYKAENDDDPWFVSPVDNQWVENRNGEYE